LTGGLESEVSNIKFSWHRYTFPFVGWKRSCESDWLRRNGSGRRTRVECSIKERLR